jgi:hypothetical protein
MSATEIKVFLTHLAIADKESASIRNPAKSALRFLYRQVFEIYELWLTDVAGARQGKRFSGAAGGGGVESLACYGLSSGTTLRRSCFSRLACAGFPERRMILIRGSLLRVGCIQPGASQYCPPSRRPGTDHLE